MAEATAKLQEAMDLINSAFKTIREAMDDLATDLNTETTNYLELKISDLGTSKANDLLKKLSAGFYKCVDIIKEEQITFTKGREILLVELESMILQLKDVEDEEINLYGDMIKEFRNNLLGFIEDLFNTNLAIENIIDTINDTDLSGIEDPLVEESTNLFQVELKIYRDSTVNFIDEIRNIIDQFNKILA